MLPLSPTGTFPSPGNKPEEERSEHDAPDWRLALPPRGVRDPLWTPGPNDADERVRSRALQEVRVLTLIHDRVAVIDPKSARPASMRDRRKVHELLMERSLAEVETILNWAYDNPRWISWHDGRTLLRSGQPRHAHQAGARAAAFRQSYPPHPSQRPPHRARERRER